MINNPANPETSEFSRILEAENLPHGREHRKIAADTDEREALASRFALDSLDLLEADFELVRSGEGGDLKVDVSGRLRARYRQTCVITLEPIEFEIDSLLEAAFGVSEPEIDDPDSMEPEDADPPEIMEHGEIDLGELVAQFLSLKIDPYARKAGVEFDDFHGAAGGGDTDSEDPPDPDNPFAKLAALKPSGKRSE